MPDVVRRTCKSKYSNGGSVSSTLGLPGGRSNEALHISTKGTRTKPLPFTGRLAGGNHFGSIVRMGRDTACQEMAWNKRFLGFLVAWRPFEKEKLRERHDCFLGMQYWIGQQHGTAAGLTEYVASCYKGTVRRSNVRGWRLLRRNLVGSARESTCAQTSAKTLERTMLNTSSLCAPPFASHSPPQPQCSGAWGISRSSHETRPQQPQFHHNINLSTLVRAPVALRAVAWASGIAERILRAQSLRVKMGLP